MLITKLLPIPSKRISLRVRVIIFGLRFFDTSAVRSGHFVDGGASSKEVLPVDDTDAGFTKNFDQILSNWVKMLREDRPLFFFLPSRG
jgi:hypothetical protein